MARLRDAESMGRGSSKDGGASSTPSQRAPAPNTAPCEQKHNCATSATYSAQGWLGSLTRTLSGASTTQLGAIAYIGSGGANGQMTSAQVGVDDVSGNATYSYSASFDTLARPTDVKTARISDGATLFEEAPTYDALGDITSKTTTLPAGTDVQQFCYDSFSRLTWAGSTAHRPAAGRPSRRGR